MSLGRIVSRRIAEQNNGTRGKGCVVSPVPITNRVIGANRNPRTAEYKAVPGGGKLACGVGNMVTKHVRVTEHALKYCKW